MENRTHQRLAAELPPHPGPLRPHPHSLSGILPLRLSPHHLEAFMQLALGRENLSLSVMRTNSISDSACIFRITLPRWIFTVASLAPISEAICLLSIPDTTRPMTSRSRAVNA